MKVHVIYHRADFDGLFSGAVCWHWLTKQGHEVELKGWDFGDPKVGVTGCTRLFVVDLPYDCWDAPSPIEGGPESVVWIDHHKSSIEKFGDAPCGYRIDGVAACRLAWQWFRFGQHGNTDGIVTDVTGYRDRRVVEPFALTLAGEYDVWDKRDPDAEAFQFGLTANGPWTPERLARVFFSHDLSEHVHPECASFVKDGRAAMKWQQAYAKDVCRSRGYYVELGGNRYWALASVHARNSSWFPNETVPEDANGLLCYRIEGDGQIKVSLYNREGHEDIDHSVIAVKYGGGGHKGACGFSLSLERARLAEIVK